MHPDQPLILITDGEKRRLDGSLLDAVTQALEGAGGAVAAVLVREQVRGQNPASDTDLRNLLETLRPCCERQRSKLLVHGAIHLAAQGYADGVHLNSYSPSVSFVRKQLGPEACIGYSAHSLSEVESAERFGADYCFYSPIFAPLSKDSARSECGIEGLARITRATRIPVFALGGITAQNANACRNAKAFGVACIGAVFSSEDPLAASRDIVTGWKGE